MIQTKFYHKDVIDLKIFDMMYEASSDWPKTGIPFNSVNFQFERFESDLKMYLIKYFIIHVKKHVLFFSLDLSIKLFFIKIYLTHFGVEYQSTR